MHPKPLDQPSSQPQTVAPEADATVDTNLIEFEMNTSSPGDDFVFEDFARLGLTGITFDKDEGDPFC
ncbi:hypothetical protein PFLUV_G00162920 [Perca fluviatilis]|uniref:Uncharacterized protein n=2 Tax=Percidae TaxID=8165 RepID=A0A6A5ECQ2_PERFL|nr:hypothetical protein PFLUV_G00162920 [Perca fluviatilis]